MKVMVLMESMFGKSHKKLSKIFKYSDAMERWEGVHGCYVRNNIVGCCSRGVSCASSSSECLQATSDGNDATTTILMVDVFNWIVV